MFHEKIPESICKNNAYLNEMGLIASTENGETAVLSYCSPYINDYIAIHKDDLVKVMDGLVEARIRELSIDLNDIAASH